MRAGVTKRAAYDIIGSVANLIEVEAAREERVVIGLWEYARVGVAVDRGHARAGLVDPRSAPRGAAGRVASPVRQAR